MPSQTRILSHTPHTYPLIQPHTYLLQHTPSHTSHIPSHSHTTYTLPHTMHIPLSLTHHTLTSLSHTPTSFVHPSSSSNPNMCQVSNIGRHCSIISEGSYDMLDAEDLSASGMLTLSMIMCVCYLHLRVCVWGGWVGAACVACFCVTCAQRACVCMCCVCVCRCAVSLNSLVLGLLAHCGDCSVGVWWYEAINHCLQSHQLV